MKKTQKYILDWDDDMPQYDDMVFLLFHTSIPSYAFADDLNRLYHLGLARQEDLDLEGCHWPYYRYRDPMAKLTYLLVERPAGSGTTAPHWHEGHKMLMILGENADRRARYLCDDFSAPPSSAPATDLVGEERSRILDSYQQELVSVSTFTLGETPETPLPRKAAKERAELESLAMNLQDCLDARGDLA